MSIMFLEIFLPLAVLLLAVVLDAVFGDPPNRVHPVAWMGCFINFLFSRLPTSCSSSIQRLLGAMAAVSVIALPTLTVFYALSLINHALGKVVFLMVSAVLLKVTFTVRGMWKHILPVARCLEDGEVEKARRLLSYTVRRDTSKLPPQLLISAAVETVAEGLVDGFASAVFYYSLFGVPGAYAYRAINTLDSMVGYKEPPYTHIGWFSARLDDLANFIPARITTLLMLLSAALLGLNWRKGLKILARDRKNLESVNAGYPISAMAGILNVQLEKLGHYRVGDPAEELRVDHVYLALKIFTLSAALFIALIATPLALLVHFLLV